MIEIHISKHAKKRARQRFSICLGALSRTAEIAYKKRDNALINDPYLLANQFSDTSASIIKKHGNAYYIFKENDKQTTLVTVLKENNERISKWA